MREDVLYLLERDGITTKVLEHLSYKTNLGKSLKNKLREFKKDELFDELISVSNRYDEEKGRILNGLAMDYRIKSVQSIIKKYERYYPDKEVDKTFNDLLGFRAMCESYDEILSLNQNDKRFKIVDMSHGKANDDGYRGVHIYFQIDHFHYPIELQYNTLYDRYLNDWLHAFIYKKGYSNEIGKHLRKLYEDGEIKNKIDFMEELKKCVI